MAEGHGDVLYVPKTGAVAEVKPGDVLASYSPPPFIKGGTIKGGQGLIAAGTVMAYETATKKYVKYNNGGSGGAEIAKCVIRDAVQTGTGGAPPTGTDEDKLADLIFVGILKSANLVGWDANAVADLEARVDTERGWTFIG